MLITASVGCAMTVLDTNIVGIVLPTIARELNASFSDIGWVISSYALCFAALLLPAGSIADRYGRKRVFLIGTAIFGLASVACGLAPNVQSLYMLRAVQGVGAAFQLAPALAVIGHAFHHEAERARAWAIWGGIMGLAMVLSPIMGGIINATLGWRWAFHINAPICAVLAGSVVKIVQESRDPTPRNLDFIGILLFASGMFLFTWALILGSEEGWLSTAVIVRTLAGLGLFILFFIVEGRRQHPMLDLSLFRSWAFVGAVVAMFAYAATAQVMASLLPMFLQNARGSSPMAAGIGMLPFALAMLVLPHVGRILGKTMASYQILTLGLVVVALGNLLMMYAANTGSQAVLIIAMAILGSGGGLLNGETQKALMATIPRQKVGMASGISTTARFSGILLGFAGLGAVMAANVRTRVVERMERIQPDAPSGVIDRMVAGDFKQAMDMYPSQWADALLQLGRESYAHGYSYAFLMATIVAVVAANVVFWSMRGTYALSRLNESPQNAALDKQ